MSAVQIDATPLDIRSRNGQVILDRRDAGCSPGRPLSDASLVPGLDLSFQRYPPARYHDADLPRLELRAALQRALDPVLDVAGFHTWLDGDQIDDACDAGELAQGGLCGIALEIPVDTARQRDPAILDLDLDLLVRDCRVPTDEVDRALRDLVIVGLLVAWEPYLDFLSDRAHTLHPLHDMLSRQ